MILQLMFRALNPIPTDIRQQVEGNRPATGTGTSVRDKQTRTTADASLVDLANADIAILHRVARVFKATPMYTSKETGLSRVIVTRLRKLALPWTPQIP